MMENINATHVTLNESDASELITRLNIKSLNAHFSKTDGCFGSVSKLPLRGSDTSLQCIAQGQLMVEGETVN